MNTVHVRLSDLSHQTQMTIRWKPTPAVELNAEKLISNRPHSLMRVHLLLCNCFQYYVPQKRSVHFLVSWSLVIMLIRSAKLYSVVTTATLCLPERLFNTVILPESLECMWQSG